MNNLTILYIYIYTHNNRDKLNEFFFQIILSGFSVLWFINTHLLSKTVLIKCMHKILANKSLHNRKCYFERYVLLYILADCFLKWNGETVGEISLKFMWSCPHIVRRQTLKTPQASRVLETKLRHAEHALHI